MKTLPLINADERGSGALPKSPKLPKMPKLEKQDITGSHVSLKQSQ
jgi:hypothetical protein